MVVGKKTLTAVLCLTLLLAWGTSASAGSVLDEMGRRVEIPDNPERIIALTPSLTEILFALGLGDRVVGATTWSDYPEAAQRLPRVGSYVSPNLEKIVSLKPDLVLANREGNPPWAPDKLAASGIPVFVTRPDDPLRLPADIRRLGEICGASRQGEELARQLESKFDSIRERLVGVQPVLTLMVIGNQPLVSVGEGTFNGKLLSLISAQNAAAGAKGRWPRLSLEYVIEARPEVIVVSTMERGVDLEKALEYWRNLSGLKDRPGFRVGGVKSDLIDRPGPRLVLGLDRLVRIIHPGLFPAQAETP